MKHLLTNIKISLLSFLGCLILKIIFLTAGKTKLLTVRSEKYNRSREKPVIIVFWHGQQLLMLGVLKELFHNHLKRKIFVLISEHNDGRLIAGAINYFGLDSIAGSSSKNAKKATIKLIRALEGGDNIAITPDGPKGPIHELKHGVIKIAQLSGYPIVPMAVGCSAYWELRSWDKMKIPKPFCKLSYFLAEPLYIEKELDEAGVRSKAQELTNHLNEISNKVNDIYNPE